MTDLADRVLPMIRNHGELWRWRLADEHGVKMHHAVDILESAVGVADPKDVYDVITRALGSACTVIAKADDSDGVIGDACWRLVELHAKAAAAAKPDVRKLVAWMMKFQFEGVVDYFHLDPVAYAGALGEQGMTMYREALAKLAAGLGEEPSPSNLWQSPHSREWWGIELNRQRLAVLDRDIDAIIATHLRDGRVAAYFEDVAKALVEIGEFDLAIDWARRGAFEGPGPSHQALKCAEFWRMLVADRHPEQLLGVAVQVFNRWPNSSTAAGLYKAAGSRWPEYADAVMAALSADSRQAVVFALEHLKDVRLAWTLAHDLGLRDSQLWSSLVKQYEKIDPLATLPIHRGLVEQAIAVADAVQYARAARRLVKMRKLAAGTDQAADVDEFIADLRERYRRRPRLQLEFDKVKLP